MSFSPPLFSLCYSESYRFLAATGTTPKSIKCLSTIDSKECKSRACSRARPRFSEKIRTTLSTPIDLAIVTTTSIFTTHFPAIFTNVFLIPHLG